MRTPGPLHVHADADDRAQALARLASDSLLAAELAREMRQLALDQEDALDSIEHAAQHTRSTAHAARRETVAAASNRTHGLAAAGAVAGALVLGPATLMLAGVKLAAGAALGGALAGALVGRRVNKVLSRANTRVGAHLPERQDAAGGGGGARYLHVAEGLDDSHSANTGRDGLLWSDCLGSEDGDGDGHSDGQGGGASEEEDEEAAYLRRLTSADNAGNGTSRRGASARRQVGVFARLGAAKTSSSINSDLNKQR